MDLTPPSSGERISTSGVAPRATPAKACLIEVGGGGIDIRAKLVDVLQETNIILDDKH